MAKYRVIGSLEVGGVAPGGTVELDESLTNIPALIEAGHVEPMPKPKKKAPTDAGKDSEG